MKKIEKSHLLVLASVALILFFTLAVSTATPATTQSAPSSGSYAYITSNNNNVSVINTTTDTVIATVTVGGFPWGVAVSSDGTKVYVANRGGGGYISVIDTATNNVTATVEVGGWPNGVAVTPDGKKVYVANGQGINVSDYVSVIDAATNNVTATVPVGKNPEGVAVIPDGTKVYVTNDFSDDVSVIDTATNNVIATVEVGIRPEGVTVTPDGTKVYVANGQDNTISVIDTATNNVTATVPVGKWPVGIAVSPDGTKVYVVNMGRTVSVIDTATNNVTATVTVGADPFGVSVSPDGTKVYVANNADSTVSVIDTATNNVTATVPVGSYPIAFGQFIGTLRAQTGLPVANFTCNVTHGEAPLSVQFTDNSQNVTAWNWDFGEGNNSTEQNPVHTYSIAGNYTVTLTASNANGTDSKLATIAVLDKPASVKPAANFIADVTEGSSPLSVEFTDLSTGSPTSWYWDFGDGASATGQDVSHTYSSDGSYTVSLTVTNAAGNDTEEKIGYIFVSESANPGNDNNADTDTCNTSVNTGNDNETNTSSDVNPGSDTETNKSCTDVKPASTKPISVFCACPTSGNAPLKVKFTDKSRGSPTTWKWNFGDGTSSTEKNPAHTYSKAGKYAVSLTTKNAKGCSTKTRCGYITVKNVECSSSSTSTKSDCPNAEKSLKAPVAAFSATPTTGSAPLKVVFTDKSAGKPTSWKWNFGDGTSSTTKNPTHTYKKAGKYTVSLTVKNAKTSSIKTMSVHVPACKKR